MREVPIEIIGDLGWETDGNAKRREFKYLNKRTKDMKSVESVKNEIVKIMENPFLENMESRTVGEKDRLSIEESLKRSMEEIKKKTEQLKRTNKNKEMDDRKGTSVEKKESKDHIAKGLLMAGIVVDLLFNIFVIVLMGGIAWMVGRDFREKFQKRKIELNIERMEAERNYILNKCDPETRVPGMVERCEYWNFIKKGYGGVKYTKIIVEIAGELVDGFLEKISYKGIVTIVVIMWLWIILKRKK